MNIGVLGWGSLLWDRERPFALGGPWRADGPRLPLEFARVSQNGRLTLVLTPDQAARSQTFSARSAEDTLEAARRSLQVREGARSTEDIHFLDREGQVARGVDPQVQEALSSWLGASDYDAVIWTGLPARWPEERGPFTPGAAVDYLASLSGETAARAREYVVKAPRTLDTPVRREVEQRLGWTADEPFDRTQR